MNIQNNPLTSVKNNPTENESNAAKKIFTSLLLACKNLALYPHDHTICKDSINQFHVQLGAFLHKYRTLRFEIERERIISNGGLISEGLPDGGTLHFSLFQVGIRWLEFLEGIELEEIQGILIILNKYTKLSSEADGDIVTAFWEAQFPHMQYEVVEFSWSDDQEVVNGISDLTGGKAVGRKLRDGWGETEIQGDPAIDYTNLELTPQEKVRLKEMILREEKTDLTSHLDVLMDSLLQNREKENFNIILGVLSEEFTGSLARRNFSVTLKILQGLRYVLDICKAEMSGADPSIEAFFLNASRLESQASLKEVWRHLDSEDAGILGQIFKLLNPQAIPALVSLLPQAQPAPLRQILLDSIMFLASKDIRPLESILTNSDEKLVEKLVPGIINMQGGQSLRCLIGLANHPSSRVRNEAVKGILRRDPARVKDIFNLIDNLEDSIRLLILEQLGRKRDDSVEDLLLSYLRNITFSNKEVNYLILCFKTLGKCGSARSISFLSEILFKGKFMPGFRRSALRRGAATALVTLAIPEAEMVLKDASRSLYPSVRSAVRKIRQEL